jgi:DNA-binding winged helix-turn-helix (wHTH) protein/tetratricopeptide (TPR) repeat protein
MKLFHAFRLDTVNHCLWRGEERLSLTPKAFDVLRYLVEHADRLVTQEEILEAVWPETYVNPEVVKKYVLGIRKVLGDQSDKPIFVATFPRRGYQFIASVRDANSVSRPDLTESTTKTIVGREGSLAQLDTCLRQALNGHRQVVFITGEAGIGKTALVDLFHQRAAFRPNLRIARGQCVEGFGGKEAYYPVLEALGQLIRDSEGSPAIQALVKHAPTWLIQFSALVKAEQKEALRRETLGATNERMVREICEALEAMTSENPLVLILEDLHWVDPSTLDFISAVARRRGPAKLVLLGTYRPADVLIAQSPLKGLKQDLLLHRLCQVIALERLEESDVAEYVAAEFPDAGFPAGLATLICRQSGGNALFMGAILHDMVEKGLIVHDRQRGWILRAPLETIAPGVPDTLQQMIEVLFERLSAPEQRILKSASVAGERFSIWSICSTLDMDAEHIENLCEELVDRQQFIRRAGIDELASGDFSAHYEFKHSLYREVIYRRLSDVNRSKLHRGIAERVKILCTAGKTELASELASHFEGARDYENAVHYMMLAAENAAERFAYRDSIEILKHGHELAQKLTTTAGAELDVRILEFIGDAHHALGAMAESAKAYEEAASRAAQAGLIAGRVTVLTCLIRPLAFTGPIDPDRGLAAMDEALQVSKTSGDPLLIARTQMLAGSCRLLYDGWRKEEADLCASAYETLRSLGDSQIPADHKTYYALVQTLRGNYQEAFDIFESAAPHLGQPTSLSAHFFAVSAKAVALLRVGKFGEALRIVKAGKESAAKNGNDPLLFDLREVWLRILALDFKGSRRICEMIMSARSDSLPKTTPVVAMGYARVAVGYAALHDHEYELAIDYFTQARDPDVTPKFFLHWIWRMTAQLGLSDTWLHMGNISKANNEADGFLESALSCADPYLQALAWEMKTRVAIAEKDWAGASKFIEQALAIVEKFAVPVARWQVHSTAWRLYQHANESSKAEMHRACSEQSILKIANSFANEEPLRATFLSAKPVAEILGTATRKPAAQVGD